MISCRRIILYIVFTVILLSGHQIAISQADTLSSVSPDTILQAPDKAKNSLFTVAGYGSNMIYLGSTISQDQPYGYAALSYGFKNSLYVTVSAIHLSGLDPFVAFYTGSLSYSHTFNSWFDISLSASRYQVAPSLREVLFNSFYYGDLTIGVDWRLLYSKISAGWLYTGENNFFYQFKNSRFFSTPSFFKKKAYITFDPYVNIILGNLSTIETDTDTIINVSTFQQSVSGSGSGSGMGHGTGSGTGSTSGSTTGTTSTIQTVTNNVLSTKFGIMELDFGIPIAFNAGRFTIEAEPGYIMPFYDDTIYQGTKGFVFMLNCYIRIF